MRKRLEQRCSQLSLEGMAQETRVPALIINAALQGRAISPRNWAKLAPTLGMQAPAMNTIIRRRRGS